MPSVPTKIQSQALYEAAFDLASPHALASMLTPHFGGRSTLINVLDPASGVDPISWDYFSQDVIAGFQDNAHIDPWSIAAPHIAHNVGVRDD